MFKIKKESERFLALYHSFEDSNWETFIWNKFRARFHFQAQNEMSLSLKQRSASSASFGKKVSADRMQTGWPAACLRMDAPFGS
jgi:hypothetical protein